MRIALLVPGGVDRSGERRIVPAVVWLIGRLARQHDVQVFALEQEPRPASWPLAGARVHNIGGRVRGLRLVAAVAGQHRRQPFDVVAAIWAGSPGLAAVLAGRLIGAPSIVHIAGGELAALADIGYGGSRAWWRRTLTRWTLRNASAVTAASLPMLEAAAAIGVTARRVPLGVELESWPRREATTRDAREPARLVHVASLNRVKDPFMLVEALATLAAAPRAFHLDIVGEDTLDGRVQRRVNKLGLDSHVTFHGFLTQRELRPLMERAHLHVMASRHEAGPLVALEAAVVGVPTVGTAVGHLAEWSPAAAMTVAPGDAGGLAATILRVLDDEPLRLALARACQQRALDEDAANTARLFEELYREAIQRRRRP